MSRVDLKLTNNTGETNVATLTGGDSIFVIPFFQRPYKWQPKKLTQLQQDILSLVDGSIEVHFLGAVIIHGLPSNPADPNAYELIDGQQRLTTLYLHTCAVIRILIDLGEPGEAAQLFRKYIVDANSSYAGSNLKLQCSKEDQGALNTIVRDIISARDFSAELGSFTLKPLAHDVMISSRILKNYEHAKRFCRQQAKDEGIERLRSIYACMLQRMSMVQIDVKDPTNGPRIFDSLNSSQEPMTIGDLVRNDVFAKKAAIDPEAATSLDRDHWQPFYERFKIGTKNHFDDYFFPFGLIQNSSLQKSEIYGSLKLRWKDWEPAAVIQELGEYQAPFLDLKDGDNKSGHSKVVHRAFRRFYLMGAPGSIYPFLMRLSRAITSLEISEVAAVEILDLLDSFLTRRAICGHEPTGLHAVFKGLWKELQGDMTAAATAARIADHSTVAWPNDEEFRDKIQTRSIYGTSVNRYVLMEYDASFGGDDVSSLHMWVEHVLPQAHSSDWSQFSSQEHVRMKDLLANLIPLTAQMNNELQNSAYSNKSTHFGELSAFTSARKFAEMYPEWTPEVLETRGRVIAAWATERWPHEAPTH